MKPTTTAQMIIARPPPLRGPIRYRTHFRWRIMPPEGASEQGFFDRSFENKTKAVEYQKRIKAKFPNEPCCLIDMGRWFDSFGRPMPWSVAAKIPAARSSRVRAWTCATRRCIT
jgi:hypothetical protein